MAAIRPIRGNVAAVAQSSNAQKPTPKSGWHTYRWPATGNTYTGEWRNHQMDGKGTYTWAATGNRFSGTFCGDESHDGTMLFANSGMAVRGSLNSFMNFKPFY